MVSHVLLVLHARCGAECDLLRTRGVASEAWFASCSLHDAADARRVSLGEAGLLPCLALGYGFIERVGCRCRRRERGRIARSAEARGILSKARY